MIYFADSVKCFAATLLGLSIFYCSTAYPLTLYIEHLSSLSSVVSISYCSTSRPPTKYYNNRESFCETAPSLLSLYPPLQCFGGPLQIYVHYQIEQGEKRGCFNCRHPSQHDSKSLAQKEGRATALKSAHPFR